MYNVLVYDAAISNLGDIFQTVALTRHLPQTNGIYRENIKNFKNENDFLIINGFISDLPPANENVLFAGIHLFAGTGIFSSNRMKNKIGELRRFYGQIGARDPATHNNLQHAGINSDMIGCSTLTFDRYTGTRSGTYSVDFKGPGTRLTHNLPPDMSVKEQWSRALEYINYYRTAERVYTTRLHVTLSCLALGTPVRFVPPKRKYAPSRYSLLRHLGVEYGKLCTLDTIKLKKRYLAFLREHISVASNKEPVMPILENAQKLSKLQLILEHHMRNI